MNRNLFWSAVAALLLLAAGSASAADVATPEQAKAMLDRAIAALKADEKAALKAFNDEKDKRFHDRDLYVFCFDLPAGNFTAYQSPLLLGTPVRELTLPPNDPIGQRAYDAVANAPEESLVTVDFEFPKPGTKQLAPKQSIEARVGNQACGVSYFK